MGQVGEVTLLLQAAHEGQTDALDRLFELLYPDLRRIASSRMRMTDERVMLDTTSLVHECYLRLLKLEALTLQDRHHFLSYAAKAMRSVVVDLAREQHALRRGGDVAFVTLNTAVAGSVLNGEDEVLHIHEALQALGAIDPRLVQVVEMRYFVGLDNSEIAQALNVSTRTVERDWERARSFLFAALKA
jgi:RNA polymerase sigma factor (TIGR02999 family)